MDLQAARPPPLPGPNLPYRPTRDLLRRHATGPVVTWGLVRGLLASPTAPAAAPVAAPVSAVVNSPAALIEKVLFRVGVAQFAFHGFGVVTKGVWCGAWRRTAACA